jgi:hypothetical protein
MSMRIPTTAATTPRITGRISVSQFFQIVHACLFNFASNEMKKEKRAGMVLLFLKTAKSKMKRHVLNNQPPAGLHACLVFLFRGGITPVKAA